MNREQWLLDFTGLVRAWFDDAAGLVIPEQVRVSCGFPSKGARSGKVLGQCFYMASDKVPQVFVHPKLQDTLRVADVMVHELAHTCFKPGVGHRAPFATAAKALLLDGPATATIASPAFVKHIKPILKQLGPYPHASLDINQGGAKQSTRLLKASCPECRLIFRITQRWIDETDGVLRCPNQHCATEMDLS